MNNIMVSTPNDCIYDDINSIVTRCTTYEEDSSLSGSDYRVAPIQHYLIQTISHKLSEQLRNELNFLQFSASREAYIRVRSICSRIICPYFFKELSAEHLIPRHLAYFSDRKAFNKAFHRVYMIGSRQQSTHNFSKYSISDFLFSIAEEVNRVIDEDIFLPTLERAKENDQIAIDFIFSKMELMVSQKASKLMIAKYNTSQDKDDIKQTFKLSIWKCIKQFDPMLKNNENNANLRFCAYCLKSCKNDQIRFHTNYNRKEKQLMFVPSYFEQDEVGNQQSNLLEDDYLFDDYLSRHSYKSVVIRLLKNLPHLIDNLENSSEFKRALDIYSKSDSVESEQLSDFLCTQIESEVKKLSGHRAHTKACNPLKIILKHIGITEAELR
ncbi:hypothetical protein LDJ79_08510 [Vibrio tritonius]|uniref:HNH nuclease domain-containing protein n=1 Tax=Vibrio tritonius TaxID=1435069 RepID=A0ABS7YKG4_9VIBR|nr:hypothetical protein [Vibrio tritonius]MCA2016150.1 hypothetical protein [Vibrio tritonius]